MAIKNQKYSAAPTVVPDRLNGNVDSDEDNDFQYGGIENADFETAVLATGYGKFNYLLLLGFFLPAWTTIFDVSNISMILPSAECDLGLSLFHKGVLNASVYAGSITTAMLWGFVSDVFGRRKLLIYGYLADSLCNMLSGLSQNFAALVFFKYLSGCIINGPYAIMMCYCAEFQGGRHRGRVLLFLALFSTMGNIAIPVLAWIVIPQTWKIVLFNGKFVYNSWRLYLTLSGVPSLIGFISVIFFPESPKFLMSQGRNDEAIKIFRKMYTMNTGKSPDQYPIVSLEDETKTNLMSEKKRKSLSTIEIEKEPESKSFFEESCEGLKQMRPLFLMPHLPRLLLVVTLQFGGMLSLNTIRLWLPQIFTILENFIRLGHGEDLESPTFCQILDISMSKVDNTDLNSTISSGPQDCQNMIVDESVYINIVIICTVSGLALLLMSAIINFIGKKNILFLCYGISLVCAASLNWSANTVLTLFLACLYVAATNISVNSLIAVTVDLFPTSLRTMSVSLIMMIGRSGSLTGNLLFSVLLMKGCVTPLMSIAGLLSACFILTIFIPKPTGGLK